MLRSDLLEGELSECSRGILPVLGLLSLLGSRAPTAFDARVGILSGPLLSGLAGYGMLR